MKSKWVLSWVFPLLGCGSVWASTDIQFLHQSRAVWANNDKGQTASVPASGLGAFVEEAHISWKYPWDSTEKFQEYSAGASQASFLTPAGIVATGRADEIGPFYCYGSYSQEAVSEFHAVFVLDSPGAFLLTGDLYARGDYGGTNWGGYRASVELSRATETIFSAEQFGWPPAGPASSGWPDLTLSETLFLSAGTYALDLRALAVCSYTVDTPWPGCGGGGGASYGICLIAIPAPAAVSLILCGLGFVGLLRKRILR